MVSLENVRNPSAGSCVICLSARLKIFQKHSLLTLCMAMDTNERAEHQREMGRIRAKRHWELHKDQIKAKVRGNYHDRKQDVLELIRERWLPQREQAMRDGCYVLVEERKSKYRQCLLCRHYANLKHTELISPFGNLISSIFCPYCRKQSESMIYELS